MIEIERSFDVAEVKQIDASVGLGDISAAADGAGQILVRARIRSNDETELETAIVDGVLKIKQRNWTRNEKGGDWLRPPSNIDLTLILPAGSDVPITAHTGKGDASVAGIRSLCEIHTGKGDVSASSIVGGLVIETGMGDVAVHSGRGAVRVETGKGDVAIYDLAGGLQVRTGAGDVSVHNWQAASAGSGGVKHAIRTGSGDVSVSQAEVPALEVHTGRGDCSFDHLAAADLRVHTGSGDVSLEGDPATGRWDVRTGKGDISLRMPGRPVRVETTTRHGDIASDLPQIRVARPGPASQRGGRSIGVIGDEPRAEILLETGHGDISVRVDGGPLPAQPGKEWTNAEPIAPPAPPMPQLAAAAAPPYNRATALAILESLARGELTVDEAEALLRSLEPA